MHAGGGPAADQLRLLHARVPEAPSPVATLVYFSGTDGTGQAITPQLPGLTAAGYDVRCLYMPLANRWAWPELTAQAIGLLQDLLATLPYRKVTLVGESFGGCLALRVAAAAPELVSHLVLVNPATCFGQSLFGVSSLVAATNLLSVFPKPLYEVAQAVLIPFMVDRERVAPVTTQAVRSMMLMSAPANFQEAAADSSSPAAAEQLASEAGSGLRYMPSATANWRLNLLRSGGLPDAQLASIRVPTLLVASAADRLLPSMSEAARLASLLPDARRVTLPDSGHTALLEEGVALAAIMARAGFLPDASRPDGSAAMTQSPAGGVSGRASSSAGGGVNASGNGSVDGSISSTASGSVSGSGSISGSAASTASASASLASAAALLESADAAAAMTASSTSAAQPVPLPQQEASQPVDQPAAASLRAAATSSSEGDSVDPLVSTLSLDDARASAVWGRNAGSQSVSRMAVRQGRPWSDNAWSPDAPEQIQAEWEDAQLPQLEAAQQAVDAGNSGSNGSSSNGSTPYRSSVLASAQPRDGNGSAAEGDAFSQTDDGTGGNSISVDFAAGSGSAGRIGAEDGSSSNGSSSPMKAADAPRHSKDRLPAWAQPNEVLEGAVRQLSAWRALVSPVVLGTQHLPDPLQAGARPLLFVGNHTRFGLYDLPLLMLELYVRGISVRGLADPRHWLGPVGAVFERFGAVKAGPFTAAKLLREREALLLFPGGGREVLKRRGEEYKLFWRDDRPDFVRLAAKYDALIVPFAAVGADDAYNLFLDTDEILEAPVLGPLARRAVEAIDPSLDPAETVLPVATLPGSARLPSPLPVPDVRQRLYFRFYEPVDCSEVRPTDAVACARVYAQVRAIVTTGMEALQQERLTDPGGSLGARLQAIVARVLPAFDLAGEARQQ